jgi:hypothetical protein
VSGNRVYFCAELLPRGFRGACPPDRGKILGKEEKRVGSKVWREEGGGLRVELKRGGSLTPPSTLHSSYGFTGKNKQKIWKYIKKTW